MGLPKKAVAVSSRDQMAPLPLSLGRQTRRGLLRFEMSGVGRRTLYRKSVTEEYLNSTPEPRENEEVALVQAPRGSNIIEIKLATGEQALAILPTRFRKLIWIKRGDFLITSTSAGDFETSAGEAGKVRHRVEHILHKEHIKHLKDRGLWPSAFCQATPDAAQGGSGISTGDREENTPAGMEGAEGGHVPAADNTTDARKSTRCPGDENVEEGLKARNGDGEEEEEEDDMSDLFVNNNRMAMMQLRMNQDDEDSESEPDSEDESN